MQNKTILGVMSGTSCDGLDFCLATFSENENGFTYNIKATEGIDYSEEWKLRLHNAFNLSGLDLKQLEFDFTIFQAEQINLFRKNNPTLSIDFIATHGHTVFHNPTIGYTHQITLGGLLAEKTKIPVVCNFREQDVILGGQGAPLVPIGDQLLFSQYDACINLGGFANISYQENNHRIAFDLCPFNILMNAFAKKMGKEYDDQGLFARHGKLDEILLAALNSKSYYQQKPPKSLSVEDIKSFYETIFYYGVYDPEIALRTLVEHYAITIAKHTRANQNILITGGGAFNSFFIEKLKHFSEANIHIPSTALINFKEALIFAFLGDLRLRNKTNILSSVTGSRTDHSSGQIYYPIL